MKLLITDWDGTLFQNKIFPKDLDLLRQLGEKKITRVVATGRNLYSAQKVISPDFPIDYLIFSSGAAIMHWPGREILNSYAIDPESTKQVIKYLKDIQIDFMVHHRVPENHWFDYHRSGPINPDFERRLKLYGKFKAPLNGWDKSASQLLAVIYENPLIYEQIYEQIKTQLQGFNVIRTTSPLDGNSMWVEIFPGHVSKAKASAWLCRRLGINEENTVAIGNDYNDIELLKWSGKSYIMETAPASMQAEFTICSSVAEAINMGFKKIRKG